MIDVKDNYPIVKPVKLVTLGEKWYKKFFQALRARKYELVFDYYLYIPEHKREYFVPKKFVCNFASIPRLFWSIVPPDGLLLIPSVFHDFGYTYKGLLSRKVNSEWKESMKFIEMTQEELDKFFEYLGKEVNDIKVLPAAAHRSLRLFGFIAWNRCRKENKTITSDFDFSGMTIR